MEAKNAMEILSNTLEHSVFNLNIRTSYKARSFEAGDKDRKLPNSYPEKYCIVASLSQMLHNDWHFLLS